MPLLLFIFYTKDLKLYCFLYKYNRRGLYPVLVLEWLYALQLATKFFSIAESQIEIFDIISSSKC